MITGSNLTSGIQNIATSFTSSSISPGANRLVIATVWQIVASGTPNNCTLSGASMTWTEVATVLSSDSKQRITIFRALSSSPGSGAITSNNGGQTTSWQFSINEFQNVVTTGTNGADAVVQSASNTFSGTNTGVTVTLSAFGSGSNATFGFVAGSAQPGITVGSGFTELSQVVSESQAQWKNSADTSVDWSWVSTANVGIAVALEIKKISGNMFMVFD